MSSGPWTLATRARHTRAAPNAERARADAIRDMASLYGNAAARARLTPEAAAWEVQQRHERWLERQWGIVPWPTERRLGPGRPLHWDGPHTGEGGWFTVAQAEAMRAKAEAATEAAAQAERVVARQAERQAAEAERQARQAEKSARRKAAQEAARATAHATEQLRQALPSLPPGASDLAIYRVTAWAGPPVQPSVPYRCPRCPHTVTILQPVLPGIYRWNCPRCEAVVRGAVG